MRVRLLKPHSVNGRLIPVGAVIELPESSARNLVEWGVGELYDATSSSSLAGASFESPTSPLVVPNTKSTPEP